MPPRRRPQFKPSPIADVLRKIMKKQGIPVFGASTSLRRVWSEAVGPQIAAQTLPEQIRRGVLLVKVASSVWMHQLQFLKKDIIQKFNSLYGEGTVQTLHFSIGEVPASHPGSDHVVPLSTWMSFLKERDERLMTESLAAINDPELKDILQRVMIREISRRRFLQRRKGR
jgi:hypothetical protein